MVVKPLETYLHDSSFKRRVSDGNNRASGVLERRRNNRLPPKTDLVRFLLISVCLCMSVFEAPGITQVITEQRLQNGEQKQVEKMRLTED